MVKETHFGQPQAIVNKPTHSWTQKHNYTHTHTHNPPVTQYDFLQIPKSDPGWNISARLPRQYAYTVLLLACALPLSPSLPLALLF